MNIIFNIAQMSVEDAADSADGLKNYSLVPRRKLVLSLVGILLIVSFVASTLNQQSSLLVQNNRVLKSGCTAKSEPTPSPTPNPTPDPTQTPTPNPTPEPTPKPTPRPSQSTPSLAPSGTASSTMGQEVHRTTSSDTNAAPAKNITALKGAIALEKRFNNRTFQCQPSPGLLQKYYSRKKPATAQNNLSTLVISIGVLRGGEVVWESLYRNLLDVNPNTDLAVFTGRPIRPEYRNASLLHKAKYVWYHEEYEDWADAIDLVKGNADWRKDLMTEETLKRNSNSLGGIKGINGSGAVVAMVRYFLSQRLLLANKEILNRYDRFVVTRSDHYYKCSHDLTLFANDRLWISTGEHWGGVNDRHLIASRKDILPALDIIVPLLDHAQQILPCLHTVPERVSNFESLLGAMWESHGLQVSEFPRTFFICSNAQLEDQTRWGVNTRLLPEGCWKRNKENTSMPYRTAMHYRVAKSCTSWTAITLETLGNHRSLREHYTTTV